MQNAKYKYLNKRYTNKSGESGFVLRYVNKSEVYFQFDSGWVGCFSMGNIRNGLFKNKLSPSVHGIGFIGDGPYKTYENGKSTRANTAWRNMLQRCYDQGYHVRQPTYIDCTVDEEWHDFQCFAKWFEENYPTDGNSYELDKDALIADNKVYGPDTCCFLTRQENAEVSIAKHYKFLSPSGEIVEVFNLSRFCKENNLNAGGMNDVSTGRQKSCKGWTKA
jgi:hypothetical protein